MSKTELGSTWNCFKEVNGPGPPGISDKMSHISSDLF